MLLRFHVFYFLHMDTVVHTDAHGVSVTVLNLTAHEAFRRINGSNGIA